MLYSRYYPPGTPPTTQEAQAKALAERVMPEPTTEEDQLKAAGYQMPQLNLEAVIIEPTASTEPELTENAAEEVSVGVSAAIDARTSELVASQTVPEMREMAKLYGLDIPPRIKEETLARMIATHEQGV